MMPHFACLILCAVMVPSAAAQTACLICAPDSGEAERPLSIEVTTKLDFARLAAPAAGQGAIAIDPASQALRSEGQAVALGGLPLAGEAVVRGTPGRAVRIDLPREARLNAAGGGAVRLVELTTDLPPAPRLDAAGILRFRFGGRLLMERGTSGHFRGRIPITADYL